MKRILQIVIATLSLLIGLLAQGQDWAGITVPANAGQGKEWELQEAPSDDFNYTFNAASEKTNFGDDKWYNFYHNAWDGPGTTYWKHDRVKVDGSNLVIDAIRNPSTTKMNVPGVSTGCITSNNKVLYPVFVESSVSVANITLASDVWLLSPDDTQEIDIIECYGGKENGNAFYAKFIHLSHHSFVRSPFQDYQPRDNNSWWQKSGITSWGEYCWNNGARKYVRIGVNWISPFHFEYYIDGKLERVLYDKAFATKVNGSWVYTYPGMTNGTLNMSNGYQAVTQYASGAEYSFETLKAASNVSQTSVIDPYNYQGGTGYTKELDIIINVESQDWHVSAGRTPTDAELANPAKNTMKVDWVRVYKPVTAKVTGVEVTPETITVGVDQKRLLTAAVIPQVASDNAVVWNSDNTSIVTVDPSTGEITGVAVGTATITATTNDGGFTDVCVVTVQAEAVIILVQEIVVSPTSKDLTVDQNVQLTATVSPVDADDASVIWSSSHPAIASVSATGLVNGLAEGQATITATANDASGKSATSTISVINMVEKSIEFDDRNKYLNATYVVGEEINVTCSFNAGTGKVLDNTGVTFWFRQVQADWVGITKDIKVSDLSASGKSSGTAKATISLADALPSDQIGTDFYFLWITITPEGEAQYGIPTGVNPVKVVAGAPISVTGVSLSRSTATVDVGANVSLTATVTPSNATNRNVIWSSSNAAIASVSNGVVTGVAEGTATITATTADGAKTATCTVTVNKPIVAVSSISLDLSSVEVKLSETFTFQPTVLPENATDKTITWQSSNTSVATIANGVVTPVSVGQTTITATSNNAKTATSVVTIISPLSLGSEAIERFVYPSPADKFISFSGLHEGQYKVLVYDLMGVERISQELFIAEDRQLDVSKLTNGIYFLDLEGNASRISFKVVVKH